jgi:hypothetical protein
MTQARATARSAAGALILRGLFVLALTMLGAPGADAGQPAARTGAFAQVSLDPAIIAAPAHDQCMRGQLPDDAAPPAVMARAAAIVPGAAAPVRMARAPGAALSALWADMLPPVRGPPAA